MVLLDTSLLISYFTPRTPEEDRIRIQGLLEELQKSRIRAIVPTPVLCELLSKAENAASRYQELIESSKAIQSVPFGTKAAFVCAAMLDEFKSKTDRRHEGASWAKAKFDWQIMAIAKVEGVTKVYSEDRHLQSLGKRLDIEVIRIRDLPIPSDKVQHHLPLTPPEK